MERLRNDTDKMKPIHPWHEQLTQLPEGKGNFYYWGPNYTADPIVFTSDAIPKVLLIKRRDNGLWAIPGGFVDENENPIEAGRRELREETGLEIPSDEPTIVYAGPVDDYRATLHAWPETVAMLWKIPTPAAVRASDDAEDAQWVALDKLPTELHGSHRDLIERALHYL